MAKKYDHTIKPWSRQYLATHSESACDPLGPVNTSPHPRAGFFKVLSEQRGRWIPAEIHEVEPTDPVTGLPIERSWTLEATVRGMPADVHQIWLWGQPIDEEEYTWLMALTAYLSSATVI